jgi:hypothetical protein
VCSKKHEKPTGAKFGGKGNPEGGEKGVAFNAHEETWTGRGYWIWGAHSIPGTKRSLRPWKPWEVERRSTSAAEGLGEVELRCVTPDGEQVVTLKEVYYIPGVAVHLFLVRRAMEKGAEVYLSKERCYVKYEGEVVMQAKGMKGLWFVKEAKSFGRKSRRSVNLAFWQSRRGNPSMMERVKQRRCWS